MDSTADVPESEEVDPPDLSAIVLCYKSGRDIVPILERLWLSLVESGVSFELVLVANYWSGSLDDTPAVVGSFAETHDHCTVVAEAKQGGMGWDMRSGLRHATGTRLIVIDGDGQNPVADVVRLYRYMESEDLDVAKGRRKTRDDGVYRSVVSWVYNVAFVLLFRTHGLSDINGKPKGLTRSAYTRLQGSLRADDWFADAEIVLEARRLGMRIGEMPVTFLPSTRPSFIGPSAVIEFVRNMIGYRLRRHDRG